MKPLALSRRRAADVFASCLYYSGETVPAGTYASLDEGRFVHMASEGVLPATASLLCCYLRLSESPDYIAPLSLLPEAA